MTNWGAAIPIIVAIIGISGVIVPSLSTPLINQIYNKPSLKIDIISESKNKTATTVNLTNTGTMPATNLSLILTANNKIINDITNLLSTVNVTLANPGSHSLLKINGPMAHPKSSFVELHVKKFVNGDGSVIKLAVGAKDAIDKNYTAYATYDQGSTKRTGAEIWWSDLSAFANPISSLIYLIVAEVIVVAYIWIRLHKRRKKRFFVGITQEMMDVRKALRETFSNKKIFSDKYWTTKRLPSYKYWTTRLLLPTYASALLPITDKRRVVSDITDYMRIDDFYSKLAERNSSINNNQIDDIALVKLNKKCLELVEDALEKIDWSKYKY